MPSVLMTSHTGTLFTSHESHYVTDVYLSIEFTKHNFTISYVKSLGVGSIACSPVVNLVRLSLGCQIINSWLHDPACSSLKLPFWPGRFKLFFGAHRCSFVLFTCFAESGLVRLLLVKITIYFSYPLANGKLKEHCFLLKVNQLHTHTCMDIYIYTHL